jgi:hypothetical protein
MNSTTIIVSVVCIVGGALIYVHLQGLKKELNDFKEQFNRQISFTNNCIQQLSIQKQLYPPQYVPDMQYAMIQQDEQKNMEQQPLLLSHENKFQPKENNSVDNGDPDFKDVKEYDGELSEEDKEINSCIQSENNSRSKRGTKCALSETSRTNLADPTNDDEDIQIPDYDNSLLKKINNKNDEIIKEYSEQSNLSKEKDNIPKLKEYDTIDSYNSKPRKKKNNEICVDTEEYINKDSSDEEDNTIEIDKKNLKNPKKNQLIPIKKTSSRTKLSTTAGSKKTNKDKLSNKLMNNLTNVFNKNVEVRDNNNTVISKKNKKKTDSDPDIDDREPSVKLTENSIISDSDSSDDSSSDDSDESSDNESSSDRSSKKPDILKQLAGKKGGAKDLVLKSKNREIIVESISGKQNNKRRGKRGRPRINKNQKNIKTKHSRKK